MILAGRVIGTFAFGYILGSSGLGLDTWQYWCLMILYFVYGRLCAGN